MTRSELENVLAPKIGHFLAFNVILVNNHESNILLVRDYCPDVGQPRASFAFSLEDYEKGKFSDKCWCSHQDMLEIANKYPSPNDGYRILRYENLVLYPFSVNLSNYSPTDSQSILRLVSDLYAHLKFG